MSADNERMPRAEFEAACEVKHDAYREWIDVVNGPLPAVKVEVVHVPRVVTDIRRAAPKDFPIDWSVA